MRSDLSIPPPSPNFFNIRRQTSIDWLLSIHMDPFQKFKNLKNGKIEDFYLHIMKALPKLAVETDWELATIHHHSADLAARIATARARR